MGCAVQDRTAGAAQTTALAGPKGSDSAAAATALTGIEISVSGLRDVMSSGCLSGKEE